MRETFLIVDGNSLTFRAFHALPLLDHNGVYTNAVQGFFSMLFKVFEEEKPAYCAVCFDEHAPTFRHTVYDAYKAGRKPTPEELKPQFPLIKELLKAMHIGIYSLEGYEADDLLGTLARLGENRETAPLLLTGDRDALQLVDEVTNVLFTKKGITETLRFTPQMVQEVYGISPQQVTDWKGLSGDSSDNIPGVPGVGDKTAVKLLTEYGSLENVLANAHMVKGKLGEKLRANRDQALFSKELATIRPTAPLNFTLDDCRLNRIGEASETLMKYGLSTLNKRLMALGEPACGKEAEETPLPEIEFSDWQILSTLEELRALDFGEETVAVHLSESLTLACQDGRCYEVSTACDLLTPGLAPEEVLMALSPLFRKKWAAHDVKNLMHRLSQLDISFVPPQWDTMLGAYLLNPQEKTYALSAFGQDNARGVISLIPQQKARLEKEEMLTLYTQVELPLAQVLFQMERDGFRVDNAVLRALGASFSEKIETLRQQVYDLTGVRGFNLNSPQQLGKVLFEDLGLPHGKKSKTGSYSTSADVLEKLVDLHPAIEPILQYRQASKLNSTYIEALLRLQDKNGRVHSTFDQTATATGRISSNEPNLQNIPVRTALGREIRRAFIPREGWVLLDADYSQIELRILAHFSQDAAMVEAFRLGQDVHTRTASEVFEIPMAEVSSEMRSRAKAVNFGLVYGISDFGLAQNTHISRREAAEFIQRYFARYPGVKRFMDKAVADGQTAGYAVTLMGRRRYLTELESPRQVTREFGKRAAMNTPVQGTAADIIKLAMVRVDEALRQSGLKARLILQVHDELILECPPEEVEAASQLLQSAMEQVVSLSVPLTAEVNVGGSWYETK
ncbi:MAG: DNA polymerase I [Clostridia bacterium]|nr:DNA polymerase I [Clostridia bacterium]